MVYGANAGGKSNLVKALQHMRGVVAESATAIQPGLKAQPFLLDAASAHQPTSFEVSFLLDGVRHQYGFAMTAERIVSEHLLIFNETSPLVPQLSVQMLQQAEERRAICDFLSAADISITDIAVVTSPVSGEMQVYFQHVTEQVKAVFPLAEESSGTRNLLFLAGPVLDILRKGMTLVIDELDAPDLFRRDQVWFVEKDAAQASSLLSLSEFSPRKNEALERGYLMGRYGGVPFIDRGMGLGH